jgi:hypothetical protein
VSRRLPEPSDAGTVYLIGVGTFLACVAVLLVGRRIVRTLELLNWLLIACILGGFLVLALLFTPAATWAAALAGLVGFDTVRGSFAPLPAGADFFLLAALVGYSGAGGCSNIVLSNWARDKGYGMAQHAGYIPSAMAAAKVELAPTGFMFKPDAESMRRWQGWWRIVRADQWGVFFCGALLGMVLPAVLYVTFLPPGVDIRGLGISAALAYNVRDVAGPILAGAVAFLGAWILFKTQLDSLEGMTRGITDILWTGSRTLRSRTGGDVRRVYYGVLALVVLWGIAALRLAQPIVLLQLGANIASAVFVLASLHLLWLNTRVLARELRPPVWRRAGLVGTALFYGFFVALSIRGLVAGAG